jgi:hypothetical protein
MGNEKIALLLGCLVSAAGCGLVPTERVAFQAEPGQEVATREGDSFVVSRSSNSIVSMRPAESQFTFDSRPVFIVGIENISDRPLTFNMSSVAAMEIVDGRPTAQLKVYSDKELISEEETKRFWRDLGAAAMAGVSDGLGNDESDGNAISQHASEVHAQRLQELKELALVDHTLAPGEQFAGKLEIEKPSSIASGSRTYSISMQVGPDLHEIHIAQTQLPVRSNIQVPTIQTVPEGGIAIRFVAPQ